MFCKVTLYIYCVGFLHFLCINESYKYLRHTEGAELQGRAFNEAEPVERRRNSGHACFKSLINTFIDSSRSSSFVVDQRSPRPKETNVFSWRSLTKPQRLSVTNESESSTVSFSNSTVFLSQRSLRLKQQIKSRHKNGSF